MKADIRELKTDVSELKEVVSANSSKLDDLHRWMVELNGRVTALDARAS